MWVVAVGSDRDQLCHPGSFPSTEQLVDRTMKRFDTEAGGPGIRALGGDIDSVMKGGCAKDAKFLRKIVSESFRNDGCGAGGKVRAELVAHPYRKDQTGIPRQVGFDLDPGKIRQRV